MRRHRRRDLRTITLYVTRVLQKFRWTLLLLAGLLLVGTLLFHATPHASLGGRRPNFLLALFSSWMAMVGEPILSPPETWYLALVEGLYPLFGFVLVGEGIIRLSLLVISREQGEKEWMRVMASTYRDHVILCGLGHLGSRVLEQLVALNVPVVAIEKNHEARFLGAARATGLPVLVADMKDDAVLIDAGVEHARAIIIASNDDMANIEVALDARRMNPRIKILMRMFDQAVAHKVRDALEIDGAFSSAALAAPVVAAMLEQPKDVLSSYKVGDALFVALSLTVQDGAPLAGLAIGELEARHQARVVTHHRPGQAPVTPPDATRTLQPGDVVVVHCASAAAGALSRAARA